ncbi:hypothetical protein [Actinoplanes sp. NPDC026623]|uniref:hypothetical protein n=1 Tax=Actinoplanes sp. NPDC026623 TaxID=3155610 RepID=UPI0033C33772
MSPLPVEAARARLIEGSSTGMEAFLDFSVADGYRVIGNVDTHWISLVAATMGVRNSWRPWLRGTLEPDGTGSRLAGTLGWAPLVKVFSALWFTGVALAFLTLAGRAATLTWSGDVTGADLLLCLPPLGMMLVFAGLITWTTHSGRRDEAYLRAWLAERLQIGG